MHNQISADTRMPSAAHSKTPAGADSAIDPQLVIVKSVIAENQPVQRSRPSTNPNQPMPTGTERAGITRPVFALLARTDVPRLLAILLLIYMTVTYTGIVVFMAVLTTLLALVLYFSFGPERFRHWARNRYTRLRDRDPDAAERLRHRAATASAALGAVVDRLPESWTQGLYLPDFEEDDDLADKWTSDPFDRLKQE